MVGISNAANEFACSEFNFLVGTCMLSRLEEIDEHVNTPCSYSFLEKDTLHIHLLVDNTCCCAKNKSEPRGRVRMEKVHTGGSTCVIKSKWCSS